MTASEMFRIVENNIASNEDNYWFLGIRFEDKERTAGELIDDYSKSNPNRDDAREFPTYGTDEYNAMEYLDGICAYNLADKYRTGWNPVSRWCPEEDIADIKSRYLPKHCYILGSSHADYGEDDNEIIMQDAVVLDIIF